LNGWCPRHDRVFSSRDGRCPKCKTALVAVPAPRPKDKKTLRERIFEETPAGPPADAPPEPEEPSAPSERPREVVPRAIVLRTGWVAVAVVVAIGVAFVAGLAFPESGSSPPATVRREARSNISVGETQHGAGVVLRLDSFEQRGRRVIMRISVLSPGDFDVGRVRGVGVVFFSATGIELADRGIAVRPTTSGFIAEGEVLSRADVPVGGVHINLLELALETAGSIEVDISKAWPATKTTQPRAVATEEILVVDGPRRLVLTGLVGWTDRLQMNLVAEGPNLGGWFYGEEFALIGSGGSIPGTTSQSGPGSLLVEFRDVPTDERRVELHLNVSSLTIEGGWSWRFEPPGR
jgi:hypothetical protein